MQGDGQGSRKRSLTSLTLQWVAERLRRAERIKEEIAKGTYQPNSEKVAASILSHDTKAVANDSDPQ
jgi:anti-sigma28 factor (negative regulator of flagellin synthesis)